MSYSNLGRRRRAGRFRVLQFLLGVFLVLAVVGSAYRVGLSASQVRTDKLEANLERLRRANLDLHEQAAFAEQRSRQAGAALAALQERYANDVASGALAELLARVEEQLLAGADPARLAFLIDAAGEVEACQGEPVTKRFVPRTPISTGAVSAIRFDDRIIVTGNGSPVHNDQGLPEAWYDPAAPVRVDFRTLDGEIGSIEGTLPLRHRMMVDGREYRFSLMAGERSFVEITAQSCPLPEARDAETGPTLPG